MYIYSIVCMYIYIYISFWCIYIYVTLYISTYIYVYIYISFKCVYIYVDVYLNTYIYIQTNQSIHPVSILSPYKRNGPPHVTYLYISFKWSRSLVLHSRIPESLGAVISDWFYPIKSPSEQCAKPPSPSRGLRACDHQRMMLIPFVAFCGHQRPWPWHVPDVPLPFSSYLYHVCQWLSYPQLSICSQKFWWSLVNLR